MSLGPWQIALIVLLLLILFGRGRISEMMGDFGKGITSFKKGLNEGEQKDETPPPRRIAGSEETSAPPPSSTATPSSTNTTKDDNAG